MTTATLSAPTPPSHENTLPLNDRLLNSVVGDHDAEDLAAALTELLAEVEQYHPLDCVMQYGYRTGRVAWTRPNTVRVR